MSNREHWQDFTQALLERVSECEQEQILLEKVLPEALFALPADAAAVSDRLHLTGVC